VTSFTITITPDDDATTTTTLRLDTSGEQVRVTDVHLHAGNGLSTGQLPTLDYGALLRAITAAIPTTPGTGPVSVLAADSPIQPTSRPEPQPTVQIRPPAGQAAPVPTTPAVTSPAPPTPRPTRGRRPAKRTTAPAPTSVPAPKRRRAARAAAADAATNTAVPTETATPATPARAAKASRATTKPRRSTTKTTRAAGTGRAYRRMPDDFATVYHQVGSAAAVADHYGVPRHTAHGWIRRLRG
jgi:hypothetical protein